MSPEIIPGGPESERKALRLLRPSIVLLCGPAGCGKSTFAERHFRPTQIISSDWARGRISDDERDQRYNAQAFALVHFLVEQRLSVNRLCVVDSTALTASSRRELLDLAKKFQVPATVLLFNVPLESCVERDAKRERSVGRSIVERQYESYEQTQATIRQEGFDQVVELQDGDLENVQIEILFRPVSRPAQGRQQAEPAASKRSEHPNRGPRPQPSGPANNRLPFTIRSTPPLAPVPVAPRIGSGQGSLAVAKSATAPVGITRPSVAGAPPPQAQAAAPSSVAPAPANAAPAVLAETDQRKLDT